MGDGDSGTYVVAKIDTRVVGAADTNAGTGINLTGTLEILKIFNAIAKDGSVGQAPEMTRNRATKDFILESFY